MLTKRVHEFLKKRTFLNVATATLDGKPNNVSKLILKIEDNFIYLVDYSIGRTYGNVRSNPRVSLSFFDLDKLIGYQINGPVELIEKGPVYDRIKAELTEKEISLRPSASSKGCQAGSATKVSSSRLRVISSFSRSKWKRSPRFHIQGRSNARNHNKKDTDAR